MPPSPDDDAVAMTTDLHPDLTRALRRKLLQWFRRHKRDLPWRRTDDPYRIWVAETMLQQTRVARVLDFYGPFLKRFPTVRRLAEADLDDVLVAWAGLGYYGRARNLHRAARAVIRDYRGRLPRSVAALRALPGVGRYSAGAVASIAFGAPAPVVDGNVARVLCRLFAIRRPPATADVKETLWSLAGALVSRRSPGNFNQAMMELGATVCTPANPHCSACPVRDHCEARRLGLEGRLPASRPRRAVPHYDVVVAVIRRGERVLVTKRPPVGLLGGLWEFPGGKRERGESDAAALRREIREELGVTVRVGRSLCTVKHAYTHFRVTLHAHACTIRSGRPRPITGDALRWVTADELRRLALPAATVRILDAIGLAPRRP